MRYKACLIILGCGLACTWICNVRAADDRGKVLATVNGATIYDTDFVLPDEPVIADIESDDPAKKEASDKQRKAIIADLLERRIAVELLLDAAKKAELDQDETYLTELARVQQRAEYRRNELLAAMYQQQVDALKTAADPATIADADVDAFYEQNRDRFGDRQPEHARKMVRNRLAQQRSIDARAAWLEALAEQAEVKINGKRIDTTILAAAMKEAPLPDAGTAPGPLWTEVLRLAGIQLPASDAAPDPESTAAVQLAAVKLGTGDTATALGELPHGRQMFDALLAGHPETQLGGTIGTLVIADRARRDGVALDPARAANPFVPPDSINPESRLSLEKQLLIRVIRQRGMQLDETPITAEQIQAYREVNAAKFAVGSEDSIRRRIGRTIRRERIQQAQDDYIAALREAADVEIFE